jgi:uncharacterized protein (DUF779 family)
VTRDSKELRPGHGDTAPPCRPAVGLRLDRNDFRQTVAGNDACIHPQGPQLPAADPAQPWLGGSCQPGEGGEDLALGHRRAGGDVPGGGADLLLGEIEGCPFHIDFRLYEAWNEAELILDVAPGAPEEFSLGPGGGMHFVVRSEACVLPGQAT